MPITARTVMKVRIDTLNRALAVSHSVVVDSSRLMPLPGLTRDHLGLRSLVDGAKPTWAKLTRTPTTMVPSRSGARTMPAPIIQEPKTLRATPMSGWAMALADRTMSGRN